MTLTEIPHSNDSVPPDGKPSELTADLLEIIKSNVTAEHNFSEPAKAGQENNPELTAAEAKLTSEVVAGLAAIAESNEFYKGQQDVLNLNIKDMQRQVFGRHNERDQTDRMANETAQSIAEIFRRSDKNLKFVVTTLAGEQGQVDLEGQEDGNRVYQDSLSTNLTQLSQAESVADKTIIADGITQKLLEMKTTAINGHAEIDKIMHDLGVDIDNALTDFNNISYRQSSSSDSDAINYFRNKANEIMTTISGIKLAYRTQALENDRHMGVIYDDSKNLAERIALQSK